MAAGYDKALFQNPGRIYNNFGHEQRICYDFGVSKILRQYTKEKGENKYERKMENN